MKRIEIKPCNSLSGTAAIPGDKSMSHRALMFASLAAGRSSIENLLEGHDCIATVHVMRSLSVHIASEHGVWSVEGRGRSGLIEPISILDCKNSGTTIRLMAGLLSAMPFLSVLDGSDQIKTRPMDRVIKPLTAMGAKIFGRSQNRLAPLVILPSNLRGGVHALHVKSAQVKSALILAGLFADEKTIIENTGATRDHTERLLNHMGAQIECLPDSVIVHPLKDDLRPISVAIPGDISSAAFLLVAGSILADNGIVLKDVGVNDTRTGIIDAIRQMGGRIELANERTVANEPVADIHVYKSKLRGAMFSGDHIVRMIDEIPVLALLATQAEGRTIIREASELKVKESNRITRTVELLRSLGANIEEIDDGMIIDGPTELLGGTVVSSFGDHRLAMLLSIAGLFCKSPVMVTSSEVTDDSFPGFVQTLETLGATLREESL